MTARKRFIADARLVGAQYCRLEVILNAMDFFKSFMSFTPVEYVS